MKKIILTILFLLSTLSAFAWQGGNQTGWYNEFLYLPGFTSLPATCSGNQIISYTTASSGQRIYLCEGSTFVRQGGSGGGSGGGDVTGPSSSVDNEIPRFDSTTGKIIQNTSGTNTQLTIGDTGKLTIPNSVTFDAVVTAPTAPSVTCSGSSGQLSTGTYLWKVSYYTTKQNQDHRGETTVSSASSGVSCSATNTGTVTLPVSSDTRVQGRKLYRTVANGSTYYWVKDINDNVSVSTVDNIISDATLVSKMNPSTINTSSGLFWLDGGTTNAGIIINDSATFMGKNTGGALLDSGIHQVSAFGDDNLTGGSSGHDISVSGSGNLNGGVTGSWNYAFGTDNLTDLTDGSKNVMVGLGNGIDALHGIEMFALGIDSLKGEPGSNGNVGVIGRHIIFTPTPNGYENIFATGTETLRDCTSCKRIIASGYQTGMNITNETDMILLGYKTASTQTGISNQIWIDATTAGNAAIPSIWANSALRYVNLDNKVSVGLASLTAPRAQLEIGNTTTTTTAGNGLIINGQSGGCFVMQDTDHAGFTECCALNGVLSCGIDANGVVDGTP